VGFTVNILTLTAGGQNRTELKVVEAGQYYGHNDLGATALTPEEVYPDFQPDSSGFARLYLWPIPLVPATTYADLEIDAGVAFTAWTLTDTYILPEGFQDALEEALAVRLLSRYGAAVAPQVAEVIAALEIKAEARIRAMNAFNRRLPPGSEAAPGTQPAKA
jgi:hypothetical protein